MGKSVDVVVSEMYAAAARLRDAGQRLQDGLASVDLETRELLGSGWKGNAASAYGPAWDQWHSGAGQVVRGLQAMSDLLTLAGKEYAKTDEQAGAMVDSTMQDTGGGPTSTGQGAGTAAPTAPESDLAQRMNPDSLSQFSQTAAQVPGQLAGGLSQAGQMTAGMVQQATQVAGGLVQQAVQMAGESAAEDDAEQPDSAAGPEESRAPRGDTDPPAPPERPAQSGPEA